MTETPNTPFAADGAELVRRHADLIYAAALRMAGGKQKLLSTVSFL